MNAQSLNRREFLATTLAGLALGTPMVLAQQPDPSGLPKRPLGRTGEKISIIGLGGWDIGAVPEEKEAIAIMHEAIDNGLTFFDNCWDYHEGRSEERMGKALTSEGRRDKVFLMTKVCARDYAGARRQLEESLKRLRTDRLDLWQFHGIQWNDDPDLIFDETKGALKAAQEARQAGKVRYIGFTGHKNPRFHLAMLNKPFDWQSVQMPLNVLDAHYQSFQKEVLPECARRRIGVLGMKSLAAQNGRLVRELPIAAPEARRFALSLPITALVCGIQSRANLRQDIEMARTFKAMTAEEAAKLIDQVRTPAADGHIEAYKVGNYGCDWHHQNAGKG